MAEVVQRRLELMSEELQEMQRIKLITSEEAREIIKKTREFENKVHSLTKILQHYTEYIAYQTTLLKTIQLRRDKKKIYEKKSSIEHKIIKRIKNLYETALQKFPNHSDLFKSFLKFCKLVKYVNGASDVVARVVQQCSDNPEIWQIAAKWHAYERKDAETAIVMLLKAVAVHKESQLLYKEIIAIELLDYVNKSRTSENSSIQMKFLSKLETIMNTIFDNIQNYEFYIDILEDLEKYEFTAYIQNIIVNFLLEHYSYNANVWHALAQQERRVSYYLPIADSDINVETGNSNGIRQLPINKSRTPRAQFEACFAKYREGLSKVDVDNKSQLWFFFIDFLFELQKDTHGVATVLKMETLKAALHDASEEKCLSERHYMLWIDVENELNVLKIAEKGTAAIPSSVELWKARLNLQIITNNSPKIDQVFKLGITALKEKALPLWSSVIRYHYLMSSDELIELLYEDGVKHPEEISATLKPQYIKWLFLAKGIEAVREVYSTLALQRPFCKELHKEMSRLESLEVINIDYTSWEKVHVNATQQFGESDSDVWINYIQFCYSCKRKDKNINEHVQRVHREAEERLNAESCLEFVYKYQKLSEMM